MRLVVIALLLAATVSCVWSKIEVTPLTSVTYSPKPKDCEIQTFSEFPKDRSYVEIAILVTSQVAQANNPLADPDLNSVLADLKPKVCELGADAIVIKSFQPKSGHGTAQLVVTAIKFKN
jgi:hypothetical protein